MIYWLDYAGLQTQTRQCLLNWITSLRVCKYDQTNWCFNMSISRWLRDYKNVWGFFDVPIGYWENFNWNRWIGYSLTFVALESRAKRRNTLNIEKTCEFSPTLICDKKKIAYWWKAKIYMFRCSYVYAFVPKILSQEMVNDEN